MPNDIPPPSGPLLAAAVQATLLFAERTPEKPFVYPGDPPAGAPEATAAYGPHLTRIENRRLIADAATLDAEGFAYVSHRTKVRDYWDEAQTLALGHAEAAELVKQATGAARVVVFDHILRRRTPGKPDPAVKPTRQPATRIHVDYTDASGRQRIRDLMGDDAEALLERRAAIINVWRPIRHPARDWPLAVCDARTVAPEDLIGTDVVYPHRKGELYYVAQNPRQRWFYVPDLQPSEALLIKCWDSAQDVARFTPHTGFEDPTTPADTPPRESIELRTIAFF